jgi:hypothetical protein
MLHRRKQIVFRADRSAEMLFLLDGTARKILFDVASAPWSPEALTEPGVTAALSSWVEKAVPPPNVGWQDLERLLVVAGIDIGKLSANYPRLPEPPAFRKCRIAGASKRRKVSSRRGPGERSSLPASRPADSGV